jgi:Mlc titration factor MtfA (ptsG expression regulator)
LRAFARNFFAYVMLPWANRKKLRSAPVSTEWKRLIETYCPLFHRLAGADQNELEAHLQVFMAEKKFEGCGGLVMSDEIKVCIAAHACLLLLHRQTDCYPSLKSVLVYPNTYVVPTTRHVGGGIMEEVHQQRAGESWPEGAVVLAWDVIGNDIRAPERGHSVIFHEFAHQLDFEDGRADGVPLLGRGETIATRRRRYSDWARVMRAEFDLLQAQVNRGESTVLREYGATNPAEFFAVATECFFCLPLALQQRHPELYGEMKWYYQQDPALWNWH